MSESAILNLMSLSTLYPSMTFLPISWAGSGGLGTSASKLLNRWSNTCTMLASPTLHVSKYSMLYLRARPIASTLVTGFIRFFDVRGLFMRSTMFPISILMGVPHCSVSVIHYSIFSKLALLAMLKTYKHAVLPLTYFGVYL